jgi:transcriptional regulator with XRE-family HTH domain
MQQLKNEPLLNAIRSVLKELRTRASLTQDYVINDIAESKKVTINLARIETGDGNISPSTIFLLCEYYGISIREFFQKVEESNIELIIKSK